MKELSVKFKKIDKKNIEISYFFEKKLIKQIIYNQSNLWCFNKHLDDYIIWIAISILQED